MESLREELDQIMGKSKPAAYNCIIAITEYGPGYLIQSNPKIDSDFINGAELEDFLTLKTDNYPKYPGIYTCTIFIHSFTSHHPQDPVEWDVNVWMEDVKKIDVKYLKMIEIEELVNSLLEKEDVKNIEKEELVNSLLERDWKNRMKFFLFCLILMGLAIYIHS
jgi:hypothetical protein